MSNPNPRQIPALSSSPRPSPLSRPHWPWSTYSHRPPSSSSSVPSTTPSSSGSWDPNASTTSSSGTATLLHSTVSRNTTGLAQTGVASNQLGQDDTMRQWSFTAFEWVVRDVHKLRDFVETQQIPSEDDTQSMNAFDILKETPILGDQKFKLEIARTLPLEDMSGPDVIQMQTLSLSLTSLFSDYPHSDEMSASIMAAVKCQDDRLGERGARADWIWETWQNEWTFRQESEVWECILPSLSSLLETPRIAETDSFVICIQIHSPTGPFYPQQPAAYYVPRDLLDGLEASLDNSHTGDVRFICLERSPDSPGPKSPSLASTPRSSRSSSTSSHAPSSFQFTARKRIIYAHSDILMRRSEYFATMLASSFSENATHVIPGERRTFTIVVEEADFVTVYWLIKWIYANWLLFQEEDDPRAAVEGMGTGWSANWLDVSGRIGEWDWKTVSKPLLIDGSNTGSRDDIGSAASGGSGDSTTMPRASVSGEKHQSTQGSPPTSTIVLQSHTTSSSASSSKIAMRPSQISRSAQTSAPQSRRPVSTSTTGKSPAISPISPSATRTAPVLISRSPSTSSHSHSVVYQPFSPHQQRQHGNRIVTPTPDPHPHPTPAPKSASALSVYQVAHRYAMPGLASLALEHIMSTITPKSSFPLLLATAVWDELHALVEDYVVERWDEVSALEDFDRCCQEVAAGEWGQDGGKTLITLFRRLHSPSSIRFAR